MASSATMRSFVLPAYAGMIRHAVVVDIRGLGAPRVCGDDPVFVTDPVDGVACSPRMRG